VKRICKDACGVASAVQETSPSDMLRGQGADFREGLHCGGSDFRFVLRDRCSTSYDLASLFRRRRSTL